VEIHKQNYLGMRTNFAVIFFAIRFSRKLMARPASVVSFF